jgi:hypothetical protein
MSRKGTFLNLKMGLVWRRDYTIPKKSSLRYGYERKMADEQPILLSEKT